MSQFSVKILLILILAIIMGIAFFVTGFIFRSQKFIDRLNAAAPVPSAELFKKNEIRAKGSSIVAFGIGGLTLIWGIIVFMLPSLAGILAIVYMVILIFAFLFLMLAFK